MKRTFTKFDYLGMFLEAFFCGVISILQPQLANIMLVSGLYSGIFLIYLQYGHASKRYADRNNLNIVFYAVCILYVLSVVIVSAGLAYFFITVVSKNEHFVQFSMRY